MFVATSAFTTVVFRRKSSGAYVVTGGTPNAAVVVTVSLQELLFRADIAPLNLVLGRVANRHEL